MILIYIQMTRWVILLCCGVFIYLHMCGSVSLDLKTDHYYPIMKHIHLDLPTILLIHFIVLFPLLPACMVLIATGVFTLSAQTEGHQKSYSVLHCVI